MSFGLRIVPARFILVGSGLRVPQKREAMMGGTTALTRSECGTGQRGEQVVEVTAGG